VAYVLLREREKSISSLGNEYKKIPPNVYQAWYVTKQAIKPRYNITSGGTMVSTLPGAAVPATLQITSSDQVYTVAVSPSQFPSGPAQNVLAMTTEHPWPPSNQNLQIPWETILPTASRKCLTITRDGSFDPNSSTATYSWIFSSQTTLCQSSGRVQSHSSSPYRAELSSILYNKI